MERTQAVNKVNFTGQQAASGKSAVKAMRFQESLASPPSTCWSIGQSFPLKQRENPDPVIPNHIMIVPPKQSCFEPGMEPEQPEEEPQINPVYRNILTGVE